MIAAGGPTSETGRKAFFSTLLSAHTRDAKQGPYIFAYDYNGVAKVSNDPTKIGKNRSEVTNPYGVKIIQELIKIARGPSGTGFMAYEYEKGAGGPITPKLSLVQNIPEIGCLVGVAVYLDNANAFFVQRLVMEAGLLALALLALALFGYINRPLRSARAEDAFARWQGADFEQPLITHRQAFSQVSPVVRIRPLALVLERLRRA